LFYNVPYLYNIIGRSMEKIKADAQEKGDLGIVAEVSLQD